MKILDSEAVGIDLHIAVCDDIPQQLESTYNVLYDTAVSGVSLSAEKYNSAAALLDDIVISPDRFDVVFMDIKMPDMDGITFGKRLAELAPDVMLVLLTAYPEYAVEGYETRAYRYLPKPVNDVEIKTLLHDIFRERRKEKYLRISTLKAEFVVPLNDIIYLSAKDKYTILHTKDMEYYDSTSLNDYEKALMFYGFFRIHRSYIVNLTYHRGMSRDEVILLENTILPISRRKKPAYSEAIRVELERRLRL